MRLISFLLIASTATQCHLSKTAEARSSNSSASCQVMERKAVDCVRVGIGFFDPGFEPPHDGPGVDQYCATRGKYIKCARQYTQCLRTVPRQMYQIVLQNVNTMIRGVCSPAKKSDLVQNLECVNKRTLPLITNPVARLSQYYDHVAKNVTRDEDLIPWTCCAYFAFYDELRQSLSRLCAPSPTPESTIQFFFNIMNQVVSEAIDLGCGAYASTDACRARLPDAMRTFRSKTFDGVAVIDFLSPLLLIAKRIS